MIFKKNKKQIIDNSLILRLKGFTRICEKEPFNYKGERYELTIYEKDFYYYTILDRSKNYPDDTDTFLYKGIIVNKNCFGHDAPGKLSLYFIGDCIISEYLKNKKENPDNKSDRIIWNYDYIKKENNSYLEKQYLKYTSKFDDFVRGYVLYNEIWIVIKNSNQDTTDKYFDKCDDFYIDKQKIVIRRESSLSLIEEEVKERNVKYMIKKYESGEIVEY